MKTNVALNLMFEPHSKSKLGFSHGEAEVQPCTERGSEKKEATSEITKKGSSDFAFNPL